MPAEKRCVTCHELRPVTDYNRRRAAKDGLQARCRACSREWYLANAVEHCRNVRRRNVRRRNVRRRNVRVIAQHKERLGRYLLEHPCVDCGEDDIRVLEFDHEGREPKLANVGELVAGGGSWARVEREIAKCSVRCASCHRRVTAERAATWRQVVWSTETETRRSAALTRLTALLG